MEKNLDFSFGLNIWIGMLILRCLLNVYMVTVGRRSDYKAWSLGERFELEVYVGEL